MNSNKATTSDFEDIKVGDYFELYVPQKTQGLVNGVNLLDSPMKLFAATILLVIPALMVFLSIILKSSINRQLNIILGIFFTAIMVLIAMTSITPWKTFYVFLAIVESCITSLIFYTALKWTKIKPDLTKL
ncbi:MAG: DUF6326 family protein [Ferruginibacter sp.]